LKDAISSANIIDRTKLADIEPIIPVDEVGLFLSRAMEGYYG
jgi:hypothetical protein